MKLTSTLKWNEISREDKDFLKEKYPKIAMDLIFGFPVSIEVPDDDDKK